MTQKYVKSTQKLCDKLKERTDSPDMYGTYYQTDWICGECGWNISYADDCVVTSTHEYWKSNVDHNCGYSGIYHTWCRKLCSWCDSRMGKEGHAKCDLAIKERETENRIKSADNEMYDNLLKVK